MKKINFIICGILLYGTIFSCRAKRTESPFGSFFLVPSDVTTVDGTNPYEASIILPVADIYYDNTISQSNYVRKGTFTNFWRATCSLSVGSNYKPHYWVLKPNAQNFLQWTEIDKNEFNPDSKRLYVSKGTFENQEIGPLTMIYDSNLINPKNLTVVISDLEEQGLNMSLLADIIRNKLLKTEDYAAALIAAKVPFDGMNYRPDPANMNHMVGAQYRGLKPLYAIVSGPKNAVRTFLRRFAEQTADLSDFAYETLRINLDKTEPIPLSELIIPPTARRVEIQKLDDIRGKVLTEMKEAKRGGCLVVDRIWNLTNMSDAMVDHLGIPDTDGSLKLLVDKKLNALLLKYDTTVSGTPGNIWRLNINFSLPKGCSADQLHTTVKNYRYMTVETENKNARWDTNELFIDRDLDVVQPILLAGENTVQVGVLPKAKSPKIQSQVVCFDVIVEIKRPLVLEDWIDDFDSLNFASPTENQDKTLNFKNFIRNVTRGEAPTDQVYTTDELLKVPVILFDLP